MELEKLSREELLQLLRQKEDLTPSAPEPEPQKCSYTPVRSNQKECTNVASTEWGFCKKHSGTVQSRRAREKYESEQVETSSIDTPVEIEEEAVNSPDLTQELNDIETKVLESPPRVQKRVKGVKRPATRKKVIRPNYWGRFEDTSSHILFDPNTKRAYGVQEQSGEVSSLTASHVAICERNGWDYIQPSDTDSDESEYSDETDYSEEEEEVSDELESSESEDELEEETSESEVTDEETDSDDYYSDE